MNSLGWTEDQYKAHFSISRQLYVRINLLDFESESITATISGNVLNGSITLNADSASRRQGNLSMTITSNKFLPSPDSYIWLNRKCNVKIGIKGVFSDEIFYFDKGNFIIDNPEVKKSSNGQKELSVNLLDYMALYDGTLTGQLGYTLKLPIGMPISEAIRQIFKDGGCTKFLIDDIVDDNGNELLIPYKIEKAETDTIFSVAQELRDMYMNYELFFNENGYLVFRRIQNRLNDQVRWNFDSQSTDYFNRNLSISFDQKQDYHNIKNHIYVIGKAITPLTAGCGVDTTKDNTANKLIIYYSKPLFDVNNQPLTDGLDVKSYFTYSGTQSNYVSAIYNNSISGFTVTFVITGEQGKSLIPVANKLFDSSNLVYSDTIECCTTDEYRWSKPNFITIDYTNNTIVKLIIKFNKPLYNSSGVKLLDGANVKTYFTYVGTNASDYISATYNTDNYNNQVTFIFGTTVTNGDTLNINTNMIYDSAGFSIDSLLVQGFTYDNTEWNENTLPVTSANQISAVVENTDVNSPFSIAKIGKRMNVIKDETIFTNVQAQNRASYELYKHDNFAEKMDITCVPIYMLDVNMLIMIRDDDVNINGLYCISQMTVPLKFDGQSSLNTYKIYNKNVL